MERDYFLKPPHRESGFIVKPTLFQFCAIISGAYDYEKNEIKTNSRFDEYPNLFALNCAKELKLLHLPYLWEAIGVVKKSMLDFGLICGIDYNLSYLCGSTERIVIDILQHRDTVPTNKSLCFGSFDFDIHDLNDIIDNFPYFYPQSNK